MSVSLSDAARAAAVLLLAFGVVSCDSGNSTNGPRFAENPCAPGGTVQLADAQAQRIDCSSGGTTVTLEGNGASYLVVPQFATEQGPDEFVSYTLSTGTPISASVSSSRVAGLLGSVLGPARSATAASDSALLSAGRPGRRQAAFEGQVLARGRRQPAAMLALAARRLQAERTSPALQAPPPEGSTRSFQVLSTLSTTNPTYTAVGARLAYAGSTLLLYVDTLAPADGFTTTQLQQFGQYVDQILVPLDTVAFGQPSDVDQNGRVIMLMSPVVNAATPSADCTTLGYVAGFFNPEDFNDATDPKSNQGEIVYSIVPDSLGTASCAHSVGEVDREVSATFLHELQHLVDFSQHVLGNGSPGAQWIDEGLSIVAEELGSLSYEQKCPAPACRTSPDQLFPDSAQGFVQNFLYDSYQYALLPDSASATLHQDSDGGFAWRGGDWLLMRWLGDHFGSSVYRKLETGPADGIADLESATGASFTQLFGDFGLALYTDSLPGLPRATAPEADRFLSRNLRQLWARLFTAAGQSADIPLAMPLALFAITQDTSSAVMDPGAMAFFRLDTPVNAATVTIRFAQPGGTAFAGTLHPQLMIFRLPSGQ